ncbi:DUF1133 family protein [Escherichia coli]
MEIKPEDELSNIVLFPVKEDDPRNQVNFLYEPSERPYCHHASVRVDEKERQVRCKICGAVVEPFDWMLSVAKRETRLADDVRHLRQEERERRKNIEKLIQIERNAKARIYGVIVGRYCLRKSKLQMANELHIKHPDWALITCRRRVDTWISLAESLLYAPLCDAFGTNSDRFKLQSEQESA